MEDEEKNQTHTVNETIDERTRKELKGMERKQKKIRRAD
jgi:hypothetical protein